MLNFLRFMLFVGVFFLLACNPKNGKRESSTNEFELKWMLGTWQSNLADGKYVETWKYINDTAIGGNAYLIKEDSSKKNLEYVIFSKVNNVWKYNVHAVGNDKVISFSCIKITPQGWVAENRMHDFPKRIAYQTKGKDSMYAAVDDGLDLPKIKEEYFFKRLE